MAAVAIRLDKAQHAFRLLSEIRRVAASALWGDVRVVAMPGGDVLLLIPGDLWASVAVRALASSYGARFVSADVDPTDAAVASSGVRLDLHPDDPRLARTVSSLLAQSSTSWAQVVRGGGAIARSAELLERIERRMRRRYPRLRIVAEQQDRDRTIWHVYRDRVA